MHSLKLPRQQRETSKKACKMYESLSKKKEKKKVTIKS